MEQTTPPTSDTNVQSVLKRSYAVFNDRTKDADARINAATVVIEELINMSGMLQKVAALVEVKQLSILKLLIANGHTTADAFNDLCIQIDKMDTADATAIKAWLDEKTPQQTTT